MNETASCRELGASTVDPRSTDQADDRHLVAGAVRGDQECFNVLVSRYWSTAVALALSKIPNPSQAEDVAQESFIIEQSVDFQGCRVLEASLPHGNLTLEGWDKSTVDTSARVWAKGILPASAERLAKKTKVELVRTGDRIVVQWKPAISMVDSEIVGVSIVVHVPRQAAAEAATTYADLAANNLAGRIKLQSTYGKLVTNNPTGPLDCSSTYGSIEVTSAGAQVKAHSTYGHINLADVRGTVDVETTYGHVVITNPQERVDCTSVYGDVKVTAGHGCWKGDNLKVQTTYGKIELSIATGDKN